MDLLARWSKVVGAVVVLSGIPIGLSLYVLSNHAVSQGRSETRAVAQRYVERAEEVIGEGLNKLGELRSSGNTGCSMEDRFAYGRAAFNSRFIQQVGIVDSSGTYLCGEPMGSLAQPVRLPSAERGDPSVMLGILNGADGDRQAIVTLRINQDHRLVARFNREALAMNTGAEFLQGHSSVAVYLEDGAEWLSTMDKWSPELETDAIVETVSSGRYPLKVVAASGLGAALATVSPLRAIVVVAGTLTGFAFFAIGMFTLWRTDAGDTFTRGVKNREFVPYYQPVFDLYTGEIKGCEVLVRWQRPDGTMIPPGQFLPYAEATGLIREITRQLMEKTVEDCATIYAQHADLKLSINLTAMHFVDLAIVDEIREIYGTSGIRYEQLCFEVTEQNPLKDINLSRAIIGRIQNLGASVALDDVGTGHGGLAYLQKLGVDIIKIDKMFIDHIGSDHSSQTIVDTLVELGNQLGLGIIAEGVEKQEQADHLKSIGVTTAQGYLFSPPVPARKYLEMLEKHLAQSGSRAVYAAQLEPYENPDGIAAAPAEGVVGEGADETDARTAA